MKERAVFDPGCRDCPRLAAFHDQNNLQFPGYHNGPVGAFGDEQPDLLIVGLAPGLHGANATNRPFTGDYAGVLLYETLHRYGFATAPVSESAEDDLRLIGARITNAVKCVPPQNKPVGEEIRQCNRFLQQEIEVLHPKLMLALGKIAHDAVIRALGHKQAAFKFAHAAEHNLGQGLLLLDSYHCSRYNTNTRRLTEDMFHAVFARAREIVG